MIKMRSRHSGKKKGKKQRKCEKDFPERERGEWWIFKFFFPYTSRMDPKEE